MASPSQASDDIDANSLYTRATAAEHVGNFDAAFRLYLSAAQAFLHLAKTLPANQPAERAKSRADAGTCVARAERIKAARKNALKPPARDSFSKEEQTYILDKSSKVNGIVLTDWSDGRVRGDSDEIARELPPVGDNLLSLSPSWRRPSEVYGAGKFSLAGSSLHPRHIRQNVVTDCSVCSAAAICRHHHLTFGSKLGLSCMFPQNADGLPLISSDGTYSFRFFINGTFRKVSIDDRLPFGTDGRPLSVMAVLDNDDVDIWPALLEKAYMKLMGGYDFPGSNSSVDVHALTGWIPEHIEINSATFVREKIFRRIQEGFNRGSCVLTLGTGLRGNDTPIVLSALDGSQTRLLPTHSYAVLGIHEEYDHRWMSILNPWNAKPNAGDQSEAAWSTKTLRMRESCNPIDSPANNGDSIQAFDEIKLASLINVSWEEVCAVFDGLFLNWDPSQFNYTTSFHGLWREKVEDKTPGCAHYYLTIDVSSEAEGTRSSGVQAHEIWILLTRHIVDKQRVGEFIAIHSIQIEQEGSGPDADSFDTRLDLKGSYTSGTHALTRLTVIGPSARIALTASYDGPYGNVCFTVQVFSDCARLAWVAQSHILGYEHLIEGAFSSRNAGGNNTYPTFMNNPQYRLKLHSENVVGEAMIERMRKSAIRLVVEGPRDVPLNVMLVWRTEDESRDRVSQLRPGDTVASSGPYSYGVAQAAASVIPGNYCIIVSTFEPRHRGKFLLRIESAVRMDLEDIPAEGAGMFCKTVKGAWRPGADGGSPRFGKYDKNPMFEIDAQVATALKLRLQLTKPSVAIALNVTLFAASMHRSTPEYSMPHGASVALDRQVTTSGAYMDGARSPGGVVTPQTTVPPGKYIAVVSTFDPGIHAVFQLLVFSKFDVRVSTVRQ